MGLRREHVACIYGFGSGKVETDLLKRHTIQIIKTIRNSVPSVEGQCIVSYLLCTPELYKKWKVYLT